MKKVLTSVQCFMSVFYPFLLPYVPTFARKIAIDRMRVYSQRILGNLFTSQAHVASNKQLRGQRFQLPTSCFTDVIGTSSVCWPGFVLGHLQTSFNAVTSSMLPFICTLGFLVVELPLYCLKVDFFANFWTRPFGVSPLSVYYHQSYQQMFTLTV